MPPKAKKNPVHLQGGLAAPGKRIQRPRATISLPEHLPNGQRHPPSPVPSPSDVAPAALTASSPPDNNAQNGDADKKMDAHPSSNGSAHHYHSPPPTPSSFPAYPGAVKPLATLNPNAFTIAATIIKTCPLQDVITILIVLLQLPPAFITAVNLLYALLTFIPSSTNASLSSLPSLNDMFLGSGGTPSIYAIVGADLVMLLLWSLLWPSAQFFALDLTQAVIAISLGGAAAGRGGTLGTMVWCLVVISFMHVFRLKPKHNSPTSSWLGLIRGDVWSANEQSSTGNVPTLPQSPSSIRSGLAIHILAQGLVRIIRRWLFRREASQTLPPRKKNDPEAAHSVSTPRSSSAMADSNPDIGSGASTDGRHPGPSPAAREGKEKSLSARKKKRQATHVRSQQPFWAALASTKVSVLKEMEQTQATLDALEADAKDANHVGNANFLMGEDRIWISEVGATEVSFGACLMGRDRAQEQDGNHTPNHAAGIDRSKPFYVRINGADWSSTRIREIRPDIAEDQLPEGGMWVGEIFGLTAVQNYYCEFVQVIDDVVIYSTSLITQQAPCDEQAIVAPPPPHSSLRPASPITTLKNTAIQNEKTLNDARNKLKRNRRDHKNSLTAAKREVESLTSRLASSGGTDERQRQRVLQLNQSIRVADEAASELSAQLENLGEIPEEDQSGYEAQKKVWRKETEKKSAARREFEGAKSEADREVTNIRSEITNALQKRERLGLRKAKLDEQYERLMTSNAMHEDVKQQHARQRALQAAERARVEQDYVQHIQGFRTETNNLSYKGQQARAALEHFENLYLSQVQQFPSPTTPEGPLPGTNGGRLVHSPGFSSFQFPPMTNNFGDSHVSTPNSLRDGRGRSSSMLSGVSNFTDEMSFPNGDTASVSRSNSSGSPGPISPPTKKPSPVGLR